MTKNALTELKRFHHSKFEVGKKYLGESFGREPYQSPQEIYEVIKRTKHFITLKEGKCPNEKVFRKKIQVEPVWRKQYDDYENSMEICKVGYPYASGIIRSDQRKE